MNVVITLEHRFDRTPDGAVWTSAAFARSFYSQYLEVFDRVKVVARLRPVGGPPVSGQRADGNGVTFHSVPYYVGPKAFLLRSREIKRAVQSSVKGQNDAIILRIGSQIANCVEPMLHRVARPYALEVLCDPYAIFAPGSFDHPLRPVFRTFFSSQMKKQCLRAPCISYVTETYLQERYPAAPTSLTAFYSDVELSDDAYVATPRKPTPRQAVTIVTVGSLEQRYKGVDTLIDAVDLVVQSGLNVRLVVIGDGRYRAELRVQAEKLGDRTCFLGWVPAGPEVRKHLDEADLFVLASRTEGLPRAMVEAMARALPCIGSKVGGIPELLPDADLVPAGNPLALASKIREVIATTDRLESMSERNYRRALDFRQQILRQSRNNFYHELKLQTEAWMRRSGNLVN